MTTPRHADTPAGLAQVGPPSLLARLARAWTAVRSVRAQPAPLVEEIEARLLYSADPAGAGLMLAGAGAVVEQRLVNDQGEFSQATETVQRYRELLIVGAGIEDSRTLQDGLVRDGRDIEVLVLDPEADAMAQISAALAGRSDLSAIHILSHGASGQLQLQPSADTIDAAVLAARAGEVGRWGDALRPGGDILLYGCDVAAGDAGVVFVRQLAALTGADVAASDDITGDSALQGDWTLEFSSGRIDSAAAFTAAAQAQWHGTLETRVNTVTQDKQHQAAVALSASGSYVVTWTADHDQDGNNTGVFAQRFDASGNRVGSQIQVNTNADDRQETSTVGIAADGSFVVAWASHNQQTGDTDGWGIKAQRFAADGSKVGSEFLVNQSTIKEQTQPSIAVAADGQFVVAWHSNASNDIYVRHYNASGNPLRGEVLASGVNSDGNHTLPAVAIAADGSYVVAWHSDKGGIAKSIFAQRFNADDTLRGATFRVNTYDAGDQTQPSVAVGGNGAFVIAWTSANQDGDSGGIYAQLYKADGSRDGAEFRVNTITAKDQDSASAAMDGAGNFTVAWSSEGNTIGVYAQRYGAGGAPVGAAFLVNTTTSGNRSAPAAAMNASGALAIAWDGVGIDDNEGVFVSIYAASNTAPTASPDAANVVQGGQASAAAPGVLANDSDPDAGATLSVAALVSPADGSVLAVTAAGVSVAGVYGSLLLRSDGSYVYSANSAAARALAAGQFSSDAFTYFARDNNNAVASSTLTFTVAGANDAPLAGNDFYAVAKTGSLNIAAAGVLSNDADPDRNPADLLTVVSVNGSAALVGSAVAGAYGTLRVGADGSLNYAPDSLNGTLTMLVFGQSVTDTFSYAVADGSGGVMNATIQITIMGTNAAPNAFDDSGPGYAVQQDGSLAVGALQGVLANDSDPDSNMLSVRLVNGPAYGTLVLNTDGSFVYTPNANYYGADSFTYRASDGSLDSAMATVTLDVVRVNRGPVATANSAAVAENGSTTVDAASGLLANDNDIDAGDQLSVTSVQVGDNVLTLAPGGSGSIDTDYGTLFVDSDGAFRYVANGAASMTLSEGALTGDAFTYTISDGNGGTATARLSIAISGVNNAPIINGTAPAQSVDDKASLEPFASVTISDADSPAQQLTVRVTLDDAARGTLSSLGSGSYDAATGIYTYTGTAADATDALRALVFTPTSNRVTPGSTEITGFAISVNDGMATATDNGTSVVSTSINDAPVITGTVSLQSVDDNASLQPFAGVTIADADSPAQSLTVSVTLDDAARGTLSSLGSGSYDAATGIYTYTGTAADATDALRALVFTPTSNRVTPGSTEITGFAISVNDGMATATDNGTSVVSTSINDAPVITGTVPLQSVDDNASLQPFAGVTIADADSPAQSLTVSVTLDDAARGTLSSLGSGSYDAATGIYTYTGTAADATDALRALVFTPTSNRVTPGSTEITGFAISVNDGMATATDNGTSVVSTSINDAPVIAGTVPLQSVDDNVSLQPFAAVTIADADSPAQSLTVSVTLDDAARGTLSSLGSGSYDAATGIYTYTGTAADATDALRALVFTPTSNRVTPGSTEITGFAISVNDGMATATDNGTSVVSTSINDAPVIAGTVPLQSVDDNVSLQPFAAVTIADADSPAQSLTVSVTLDDAARGTLSSLGSGSYDAATGIYTYTGTAADATDALRALVFTPTSNRVTPGSTEITGFAISVNDGMATATDISVSVVSTSINDAPVITGTTAAQSVDDNASLQPFAAVTIADADSPAQSLTVSVTLDDAARGTLSSLGSGSYDAPTGIYTYTGTAADATDALRALVFTPTSNRVTPGSTEITGFAISVNDGMATATDNGTSVVSTSINDAPVITGTVPLQSVDDNVSLQPFAAVTIADADSPAQSLTVSVTLDDAARGTLSSLGSGSYDAATGIYTYTGTAADATDALRALVFTPTSNRVTPGSTEITGFAISVNDGMATATDNGTSVVSTSINDAPVITGTVSLQSVDDNASLQPFAAVTIADADSPAQSLTVSVTLDDAARGTLSSLGSGSYDAATGIYTYTGTAADATDALRALVFTPTSNRVTPGSTEITGFAISVNDGMATATDNGTSVVSTSINDAPVIAGTVPLQSVDDNASLQPFASVTISDADSPAQQLTVRVTLDDAARGTLSSLGSGSYDAATGIYTYTGTAADATDALRALVFTPTSNRVTPGSTEITGFAISVNDGMATATDNGTSVVSTSINDAPVITGTVSLQSVDDNASLQPFAGVTIADADSPAQSLTVSVTLDDAARGTLSSLGSGSYDAATGIYTYTGTAADATDALRALVFTPTSNRVTPGSTEITGFAISVNDGMATATDISVSVVSTSINDAPVITGTTAAQSVDDNASLQPFAGVTIADADSPAQSLTVSVTLDDAARGTLSSLGSGSYDAATGIYTYTGTAADATDALRALVFTPTSNRVTPGSTEITGFAISVNDGMATATDISVSVVSTSINDAPVITGTVSLQSVDDNASLQPFAGVTIADADSPAQSLTVSVTLDDAARGTLSSLGSGSYDAATGIYTYTGTAADATDALRALVFTPTSNRVTPGSTEITGFAISVNDGMATATDNGTSVVSTSINDAPVITGTVSLQSVDDNASLQPFAGVTIADADSPAQSLTVSVTLDDAARGTLSSLGSGSYDAATGIYTYTGTAADATDALRALVFTPTSNRVTPGSTEITGYTISVNDGMATATDNGTSVVSTSINDAPVITGTVSLQSVDDNASLQPFAGVTIADADSPAQSLTVSVTLDDAARGTLSSLGSGSYDAATGIYTYTGTAADATDALRALVFTPTSNRVTPGSTEITGFAISVNDGMATATDISVSVVSTSINDAPVITGTVSLQSVDDNASLQPFAGVTIADADSPAQSLTVSVTLDDAARGTLSSLGSGSYDAATGIYTYTGTAADATDALRALVFTPTSNRVTPGSTEITGFAISVNDGMATATDNGTSVVSTSINDAPVITGTVPLQSVDDNASLQPFAGVTIADADSPAQSLTVSVTLDDAARGTLSSLGSGSYDAATGIYTYTGTAADATDALRALVFTPTSNRVTPGSTEITGFAISVNDGMATATDISVSVVSTSINDAPVITGTVSLQSVDDNASLQPFAGVTIADADSPAQSLTVSVTLDDAARGTLSSLGSGSYDAATGIYTYTGTAADATDALRALVFTPTSNRVTPGSTEITGFAISVNDGMATATDISVSVVSTSINDAPVITGTTAAQSVDDNASLQPFAGVTIADADSPAQSLTVSVTLDDAARGTLSSLGSGSYDAATGIYTYTGTAADATDALRALVFTPTSNRVTPGSTEITSFAISVNDGMATATDNGTSVVSTSINDAPVIAGTVHMQSVDDNASFAPFAGMTVADVDSPAQQLTLRIALDNPTMGRLSGTAGSYDAATGVYAYTGTATQINAVAQGLKFSPEANHATPGSVERVAFSITVSDGALGATGAATVDVLSVNDAPAVLAVTARAAQDSVAFAIVLSASDIDGGDVSMVIASAPAQGALYLDAAGLSPLMPGAVLPTSGNSAVIYFRPEAGWNGVTGFTYAAIDAQGLKGASAAVSVAVAASPPAAVLPAPPQETPSHETPSPIARPQATQPVEPQAQPQQTKAPAALPALAPATTPAPAVETLAVPTAEPTQASATAPAPALTPPAALAASSGLQAEAVLPSPQEASVAAQSNQEPALAATAARSNGERASRAAATLLAAFATADAGGEALLAADLVMSQALADGRIERAGAAARSETLARSLDQMRDSVKSAEEAEHRIVGSSVAVGASLSVGYVIWLLRGGVLATSLLSSLPAWRFVDPLPVLARMRQGNEDDDSDDSLESLVADDDGHEDHHGHQGRQDHGDAASPLQALEPKP